MSVYTLRSWASSIMITLYFVSKKSWKNWNIFHYFKLQLKPLNLCRQVFLRLIRSLSPLLSIDKSLLLTYNLINNKSWIISSQCTSKSIELTLWTSFRRTPSVINFIFVSSVVLPSYRIWYETTLEKQQVKYSMSPQHATEKDSSVISTWMHTRWGQNQWIENYR